VKSGDLIKKTRDMAQKTTADVLKRCQETLSTARFGLEDIKRTPERRLAGLRNLMVFGRAVTNIFQNLRSIESNFDDWYTPLRKEIERDPLMRYFYTLRSEILKQGSLSVGTYAYIRSFQYPQDLKKLGPPPPNAKSFFIGDQLGGSGWEVVVENGSVEMYYVDLPGDIGQAGLHLPEAPEEHLGQKLKNKDVGYLGELYLRYLEKLIQNAKQVFLK